ncbi:PilZ domain-containing protein [Marinobacterium jannaschii]|uniref:PilZ domain-containing protein n=1 Tax=Marinobacterium jannaschii TaxID=64970 RepID=UPI0004839E4E|nr:PilZ domain-containing protein [Marinobacterium jannaschii]
MRPERRIYPRLCVELPAELEKNDADTLDVTLLDISQGGFLLEGGTELMQVRQPATVGGAEFNLHFGLADSAIHCHCRMVHQRRVSQHRVQYGVSILSIDQQGFEILDRYIKRHLV